MKTITVIESEEELVKILHETNLVINIGVICNAWISMMDDNYQISANVNFEGLFMAMCNELGIRVQRVGGAE